ncbi:MAG: MFS transporter [Candidatus Dormibacteria bacterium]
MTDPVTREDTARGEVRLRTRLLALTWAHLLNDGASNYLPGVLPAVLVAVHGNVHMAGVLMAALMIGQALQPFLGWIADGVGGRWFVALGLLLSSLGGGLLGVTNSLGLLIVILLMIGIGSALFHPQALAGVRSMLQGRHGLFTSLFLVGGEIGRGIWPTAASLVAANLGLQYLWIIAIPGLLTVIVVFRLAPQLPARPRSGRVLHFQAHSRPLLLLLSYSSIRAFTIYGLVTFIPILWHLHGGSLVSGATIISTIIVVGVVGNLFGGHLADVFGRRPVLVVSTLAIALLVVPIAYAHGAWIWVLAALLGPLLFLTASTTILIGQDIFPENRSMGSGIALGLANGLGALLVLVIGFLVNDSDVMSVFWVLAALSCAAVVPALALPRTLMGTVQPSETRMDP